MLSFPSLPARERLALVSLGLLIAHARSFAAMITALLAGIGRSLNIYQKTLIAAYRVGMKLEAEDISVNELGATSHSNTGHLVVSFVLVRMRCKM